MIEKKSKVKSQKVDKVRKVKKFALRNLAFSFIELFLPKVGRRTRLMLRLLAGSEISSLSRCAPGSQRNLYCGLDRIRTGGFFRDREVC